MALMTQKAYADRKGVTPQYVNKLVSQGKIRLVGRKVDPKQADAAILAFRRAGRVLQPKRTANAKKKAAKKKAAKVPSRRMRAALDGAAPELVDPNEFRTPTGAITASRAVKEYYQALREKTLHEKDTAKLLPAAEVLEAERKKNATLRMLLASLPRTLAHVLAMTVEPAECEAILSRALDQVREEFAADPLGLKAEAAPPMEAPPVEVPVPAAAPVAEGASA
jgi:hypothetical protein